MWPKPKIFKGWTVPGPEPFQDDADWERDRLRLESEIGEGVTCDSISGRYRIFQLAQGHRFSTDDLLVAWYGAQHAGYARRVLDLGSGIGSVAQIAAWRMPGAEFVTIEAQKMSVALARASISANGLAGRFEIFEGDFRSVIGGSEKARGAPDREDPRLDLALCSPPYFPLDAGIKAEHAQKIACRFEVRGDVRDYLATALRAGAESIACVFPIDPPHQRARIESAAKDLGLTILRLRPVQLRRDADALLGLFILVPAEALPQSLRAQTWIEPTLVIREINGQVSDEYRAIKLSMGFPP